MGTIIEKGQDVYVALLDSKKTTTVAHAIGLNEKATSLNCFSKALQFVKEEYWDGYTEAITLLRIRPYVYAFDIEDIEVGPNNSVSYPPGAECTKLGTALVSLSCGDTSQLLNFKLTILKVDQRRTYDCNAN